MGRRTRHAAQPDELQAMAEKAQDLAIEIDNLSDRVEIIPDVMDGLAGLAARFNQLAEATARMNRKLLALAQHKELTARAEAKAAQPYRCHDEA